jgi:hypothetical protein
MPNGVPSEPRHDKEE